MKGLFITLEGIDGTGKTTQAARIKDRLEASGLRVTHTREPGGTALGKAIRELFLSPRGAEIDSITELLMMAADRAQHVKEVVLPALERGEAVVCERYTDSTEAYQGYGGGVPLEAIRRVNALATGGLVPTLTFLLDLDPGEARKRWNRGLDRMEARGDAFYRRVREGYLSLARENPERICVIDASLPPERVEELIVERLAGAGVAVKGGAGDR